MWGKEWRCKHDTANITSPAKTWYHCFIVKKIQQFSFSVKSKVVEQVYHFTLDFMETTNRSAQDVCSPTCCGFCCGDFPSEILVFPHHILAPVTASDWAEGNLGLTATVASDWHCLSHLNEKILTLAFSKNSHNKKETSMLLWVKVHQNICCLTHHRPVGD